MIFAFALLCAFIFAALFGSRQARTLAFQVVTSIAIGTVLLVGGLLAIAAVAHH